MGVNQQAPLIVIWMLQQLSIQPAALMGLNTGIGLDGKKSNYLSMLMNNLNTHF